MRIFVLLIPICLLAFACKNTSNNGLKATDVQVGSTPLPADFEVFYQQFHADSAYQMAHIAWPLDGGEGVQVDSFTTGVKSVQWTPEKWRFQTLKLLNSGEFIRERSAVGEVMVVERIRAAAVPYGIERRFAKQANGEWELIYYNDVFEFK